MSLVNDMLRDLDQRRKESEGTSIAIRLTPATEFPNLQKSRTVLYVLAGLLAIATGLAYLWWQLNSEAIPQQLNIRPQLTSTAGESQALEEPGSNAEIDGRVAPISQQFAAQETIQVNQLSVTQRQDESQPDREGSFNLSAPPGSRQSEGASNSSLNSQATEFVSIRESRPGVGELNDDSNSEAVQIALPGTDVESAVVLKDAAELSPAEMDTISVQQALRLIANNQSDAAYATLEQYISENPYAHQSREFYANFLMSQGLWQQAFDSVESGLTLAPNHPGYKKVKARILIANEEFKEAAELLLNRAPEVSSDPVYHEILAFSQLTSGDFEGAINSYTSLVRQDQSQGNWWFGFAKTQDLMGNSRAARQAYTRAMQLPSLSANFRLQSQERLTLLSQ